VPAFDVRVPLRGPNVDVAAGARAPSRVEPLMGAVEQSIAITDRRKDRGGLGQDATHRSTPAPRQRRDETVYGATANDEITFRCC
jgi:hypothetical protein